MSQETTISCLDASIAGFSMLVLFFATAGLGHLGTLSVFDSFLSHVQPLLLVIPFQRKNAGIYAPYPLGPGCPEHSGLPAR